jgi:hypothetical protein
MIDVFVSAMIFAFIHAVITAGRGQNFNVNSERESEEERRREALKARAVDQDKKLRLDRDNCALLGPDGKFIRSLLPSEEAGISLWDTFHPGYADEHVDEMIYHGEELEKRLAWMEKDKKGREHFIAWWKSASYEQRLVVVKRWYDTLYPQIRAERAPAEEVANIANINSDWFLAGVLSQSEARSREKESLPTSVRRGGCQAG